MREKKKKKEEKKPTILHFSHGSKTDRELYRVIANSKMDNDDYLVRLCYTCQIWFKLHKDFLDHIISHVEEIPSVGLGMWTNPNDPELQEQQLRDHFLKTYGLR